MQVSEKDKLREEFELKSQNIVAILSKKTEDLIGRDRDLLQGMLKVLHAPFRKSNSSKAPLTSTARPFGASICTSKSCTTPNGKCSFGRATQASTSTLFSTADVLCRRSSPTTASYPRNGLR